jgi:hypothetical protein
LCVGLRGGRAHLAMRASARKLGACGLYLLVAAVDAIVQLFGRELAVTAILLSEPSSLKPQVGQVRTKV